MNRDLAEENKRLVDRTRALEKDYNNEKMLAEKAKREYDRALESQKRDMTRELERKEKEIKEISERSKRENEKELKRVTTDL